MKVVEKPYSKNSTGLRLRIRLTPKANRDVVDGLGQDAHGQSLLQVRLKALPVEGAANRALVKFLASELKLRKSDVELVAGARSRVKIVHLKGETGMLEARLAGLLLES